MTDRNDKSRHGSDSGMHEPPVKQSNELVRPSRPDSASTALYDSTQTINFDGLFKEALTSSGSFDIRTEIWATTFGKVLQAMPIPALLVDTDHKVFVANEACGKTAPNYKSMLGAPLAHIGCDPAAVARLEDLLGSVFSDRKSRGTEGTIRIDHTRLWARITLRPIRVLRERFVLVLIEDLTTEKRRLQENQKLRQELEDRVRDRTALLADANEKLTREIERRAKYEDALRKEKARFETLSEHSPFALGLVDAQGAFTYVNPRFTELVGYVTADTPKVSELLPDMSSDIACVTEAVSTVSYPAKPAGDDERDGRVIRLKRKDGGERTVDVRWRVLQDDMRVITLEDVTERIAAEEAVRFSEERFRTLFETSLDAIAVVSRNGRFLEVNRSFCELVEYKPWELEEMAFADLWESVDELRRLMRTVDREGAVGQYECVFRTKNGAKRFCVVNITHGRIERNPTTYQLIVHDVTQQKCDQEALRVSEEQYRGLYRNALVGLVETRTEDGQILKANETFACKILGFPNVNALIDARISVADFYDSAVRAQFLEELRQKGYVNDFEMHFVRPDGEEIDVAVWGRLSLERGVIEGAVIDISRRKRAERALRASEEKFRNILETIADGYHEVNLKGAMVIFNNSLCEILGYSRDELLGKSYRDLMDEENAAKVFTAYNRVFLTGEPEPYLDYRIIRKDKITRDASVSIALIRDQQGRPTGFRGIMRDTTARKQMEEQLRQAAKMEAIGRLAGGVAHDFNNLMTAVTGYSEMLLKEKGHDPPTREKIEQVLRSGHRASALTRQLLAFGRKQVLDVKVIDINAAVRDTALMMGRILGEHIELMTKLEPHIGAVEADPVQIEQLLMNLLVNARDAMPSGGTLTIETSNVTLDDIHCEGRLDLAAGAYVMLCVTDTGPGMDEQTRKHIFEPFFTTKKTGEGTGLGLSTAYGIVKMHRGHITVYSEPDLGASFKVYLPRVDKPVEEVSKTETGTRELRGTETVLVVEDEEVVLDLVCQILEMSGYVPLRASNPQEALRVCAEHPGTIHLLVTDVVLPKMDGHTLYETIAPTKPNMKVLYVSGHTENFIVHRGILDPGIRFLQKPFSADALAEKIRAVLDDGS